MISIPPVCASGWPETRREKVERDSTGRAASFADIEPHALATIVTYSVHGRRIERSTRSVTFARYDGAALTRAMRGRRARCHGCVSATSHYDDVVAAAPHHQQQQQQQQHLAAAVCRQPQCTACDRLYTR